MNRRGFLSLLGAAASAPLVPVPELAELLAPKRTIFLPPAGGWIAGNRLLTVEMLMAEAFRIMHDHLEFVTDINREYDQAFRAGSQWINVHLPARYA